MMLETWANTSVKMNVYLIRAVSSLYENGNSISGLHVRRLDVDCSPKFIAIVSKDYGRCCSVIRGLGREQAGKHGVQAASSTNLNEGRNVKPDTLWHRMFVVAMAQRLSVISLILQQTTEGHARSMVL